MSDDLSTLTDRELSLLILQEVRGVARSLDGLAQSIGRHVGGVMQKLETLDTNVNLTRDSVRALGDVVRGTDFLAHEAVKALESRVEALEHRPRLVNGGE